MGDFSTDAILLRKIEYGDHDLIISFLTRDRGKISVMAKNAKKSVRRFSGAMDLFSVNHIQCVFPKKNKDAMINLCQTVLENGFPRIRYNVVNTAYASYWTEIVSQWLEEGKAQPEIFELLYTALDMVNDGSIRTEVISLLFQIRFMRLSGFSPGLDQCDDCCTGIEAVDSARLWFDFKAGRVVCPTCKGNMQGVQEPAGPFGGSAQGCWVSKGTLKQLSWINTVEMARADRIKFSPIAIQEGETLLESFIPFHIGRHFNSLKFLHKMRSEI
ncbi:MAG: DNA repair protein RecO [Desulfobacterales bacterium]|nr:DNA repair protein RecO [Desulfobacterales bacterium]